MFRLWCWLRGHRYLAMRNMSVVMATDTGTEWEPLLICRNCGDVTFGRDTEDAGL